MAPIIFARQASSTTTAPGSLLPQTPTSSIESVFGGEGQGLRGRGGKVIFVQDEFIWILSSEVGF